MSEAGPVIPVDVWMVAVLVLAAWVCWAVACWRKRRETRDARDSTFARNHRIGRLP